MRSLLLVCMFAALMLVSACEESPQPPPSVGTEIPGGFVVTNSKTFERLDKCVEGAKRIQSQMNIYRVDDSTGNSMYTAQIKLNSGETMLHACIKVGKRQVNFTEAKKIK